MIWWVPDELSLQRLPLVGSPLMSLTICHGHPHLLGVWTLLLTGMRWLIGQDPLCLPLAQSLLSWKVSCTFSTLKPFGERYPYRYVKLYTKKCLFGMKKMHLIFGAVVKHKVPLTALARLTLACISSAVYPTHLTTYPPLLYTLQHGWLRSHQDLHRDGLCWSSKCFSLSCTQLNLESFLVSLLLSCLSVSGSFLIKLSYLTQ